MNIYITLDYELFFGNNVGTLENCMLKPANEIARIANENGIKLVFFIDSGYLLKLKEYSQRFPELKKDLNSLTTQIKRLSNQGHTFELHIHPHWEDSYYDGKKWIIITNRYRLHSFEDEEIMDIFNKYTKVIKDITGRDPIAFRAGGWSVQPFSKLKQAFIKNRILIDSSVFSGGYHNSKHQFYDFQKVPKFTSEYYFDEEITETSSSQKFKEIPISSMQVSPLFFWKLSLIKVFGSPLHNTYGDGQPIKMPNSKLLKLLTFSSNSVVSIDGYKASYLKKAYGIFKKNDAKNFVIIGHPKAFTKFSLIKFEKFLKSLNSEDKILTFGT